MPAGTLLVPMVGPVWLWGGLIAASVHLVGSAMSVNVNIILQNIILDCLFLFSVFHLNSQENNKFICINNRRALFGKICVLLFYINVYMFCLSHFIAAHTHVTRYAR